MTVERNRIGWGFGLLWVFLSAMGWSIGFTMGFVAGYAPIELIGHTPIGEGLAFCVHQIVLGAVVGILQWVVWVVLRRRVLGEGRWVWASIAGLAVAGGVGGAVLVAGANAELGSLVDVVGYTLVMALGGAVTGVLQRPVLRGQVSRAGWWVLASTVGWGLGMAVSWACMDVSVPGPPWGFFGSLAAGGVAFGAVTGGALVWLLRQPVPEA
jgi:hypothetical protein